MLDTGFLTISAPRHALLVPAVESFMQVVPFVFAAELLKSTELAIAELLIESGSLKAERIEKGVLAAAQTCFVFCGAH